MSDKMKKQPEACAFWRCKGMDSPFACDHRKEEGEIGQCRPRKMPCELETGKHDCGMFLKRHSAVQQTT